jgi:hypothetical protein
VEAAAEIEAKDNYELTAIKQRGRNEHEATFKLLPKKGAAVDGRGAENGCLKAYTVLHGAAQNGHAAIVGPLLEHGADVDAKVLPL